MKVKPAVIALIMLGVYLVSTIAYVGIRSGGSNTQLPKDNILDYKLDFQLRNAFIYYGSTILTFEYSSSCDNCFEQKDFLENMASQFKQVIASDSENQVFSIYLEKLLNETVEPSELTIESKVGNRTLVNPTQNETFDAICDLMSSPPVICVAR